MAWETKLAPGVILDESLLNRMVHSSQPCKVWIVLPFAHNFPDLTQIEYWLEIVPSTCFWIERKPCSMCSISFQIPSQSLTFNNPRSCMKSLWGLNRNWQTRTRVKDYFSTQPFPVVAGLVATAVIRKGTRPGCWTTTSGTIISDPPNVSWRYWECIQRVHFHGWEKWTTLRIKLQSRFIKPCCTVVQSMTKQS